MVVFLLEFFFCKVLLFWFVKFDVLRSVLVLDIVVSLWDSFVFVFNFCVYVLFVLSGF